MVMNALTPPKLPSTGYTPRDLIPHIECNECGAKFKELFFRLERDEIYEFFLSDKAFTSNRRTGTIYIGCTRCTHRWSLADAADHLCEEDHVQYGDGSYEFCYQAFKQLAAEYFKAAWPAHYHMRLIRSTYKLRQRIKQEEMTPLIKKVLCGCCDARVFINPCPYCGQNNKKRCVGLEVELK